MNYSELLQLAKGWSNFVSDRINILRLRSTYSIESEYVVSVNDKLSAVQDYLEGTASPI